MKKLILSILMLLPVVSYAGEAISPLEDFRGGVDVIAADKLNQSYAPFDGILNVRTDEYSQITTRLGTQKYNTTALPDVIRSMYTYNKSDGTSYMIAESSSAVYSSPGDTNFTAIITTRTITGYRHTYTVIADKLYGSNGVDDGWSWDGADLTEYDVTNSTGYPKGRYCAGWLQRQWIAGNTSYGSRLYYSESADPANFQNFLDVATDDGDWITGLYVDGNTLIVTKNFATYRIYQYEAGGFNYRQVSNNIGCLYQQTMTTLNGLPTWWSHRGIEQLNGSVFNEPPLSEPIRNYFKTLPQRGVSGQSLVLNTESDWGAGSGTNIDTTTYSGSVSMIDDTGVDDYTSITQPINDHEEWLDTSWYTYARQRFTALGDVTVSSITIVISKQNNCNGYDFTLKNQYLGVIYSSINVVLSNVTASSKTFYLADAVTLAYGAPYYIQITKNASSGGDSGDGLYIWGEEYYGDYPMTIASPFGAENTDTEMFYKIDVNPILEIATATYTSAIQTANSWTSWGGITIDETAPSSSTITHYVKTSTATDNFSGKSLIQVTNGTPINSTVGPYIQYFASFTRTDPTNMPMTNKISITYFGSGNSVPQSIVFERSLYVSCMSPDASTYNDIAFVYQKDGTWTKYTQNAGAYASYRNDMYFGSSVNGYVYQSEVPDLYSDDGAGYAYYWTSKPLWTHGFYRVYFKNLWVQGENTGDYDLTIGYRYDESSGDYTTHTLNMGMAYPFWKRLVFPPKTSRAIQVKVGDFTGTAGSHMNINRMYLNYSDILAVE